MLSELLSSDELALASEEEVFRRLMKWHTAQLPPPAEAALVTLLEHVRFPLMAAAFVNQTVMVAPLMRAIATAQVLTRSLLDQMTTPAKVRRGAIRWHFEGSAGALQGRPNEVLTPWVQLPHIASTENLTLEFKEPDDVDWYFGGTQLINRAAGWWRATKALCNRREAEEMGFEVRCLAEDGACVAQAVVKDIEISSSAPQSWMSV